MQSMAFDRIAFKHYLLTKGNFSEKAGEWACIWADRFLLCYPDWSQHLEKAIAAFAKYLSRN